MTIYDKDNKKGFGRYAMAGLATLPLVFGACNVDRLVKSPPENVRVLNADYGRLSSKCGDYWGIIDELLRSEGQPHGLSQATTEAEEILSRFNPSFFSSGNNPFNYSGRFRIPDLNGDGGFSPKLMACGSIEKPEINIPYLNGFRLRKTTPRSGKR